MRSCRIPLRTFPTPSPWPKVFASGRPSVAARLHVLIALLKRDRFNLTVTSEVLPGVTRTFESLSTAAEEATLSRIFAGVHFRFDSRGWELDRRQRQRAMPLAGQLEQRVRDG